MQGPALLASEHLGIDKPHRRISARLGHVVGLSIRDLCGVHAVKRRGF
jgi:hypothetical protein